jgi:hypothetical protein
VISFQVERILWRVGAAVVVELVLVEEVEALFQRRENTSCCYLCYHIVLGK